VQDNGIL